MKWNQWSLMGALAIAAIIAAVAKKWPACWGLAAAWGLLSLGMWLWQSARAADEAVKIKSNGAAISYATGQQLEKEPTTIDVKRGALAALGALFCVVCSVILLLSCFVLGLGWGVVAWIPPLACVAAGLTKNGGAND